MRGGIESLINMTDFERHMEEQRLAVNRLIQDWTNESLHREMMDSLMEQNRPSETQEKRKQNFREFVRNK